MPLLPDGEEQQDEPVDKSPPHRSGLDLLQRNIYALWTCSENESMQVIDLDKKQYQTLRDLSDQSEVLCGGNRADMR